MTAGEGSRRTTEAPTPLLPKAVVDELEGRNLASHEVCPSLPGVRSEICEMFQCPASGHLDDIAIQVRPTRGVICHQPYVSQILQHQKAAGPGLRERSLRRCPGI